MQPVLYLAPLISLLASSVQADGVKMYLYEDNDCTTLIPGDGTTTVEFATCDTNVGTGWSSAKVISTDGYDSNTLTFYTKNDCGCPTCGSHGYVAGNFACLNNFGFVANAVGLYN